MADADLVSIASGGLTARIHPLGAELWSLTDAQGREYMTDADPAFWTGHAPILFPIVGELRGGTYRLGDREFAMARHGFARRSPFALVERRADVARFRLTDSDETRAHYPFAFVLEMGFRLTLDGRLEMEARIANPGNESLPFSFGFHPAFAWPLPDGGEKLAHAVTFEHAEPADIRCLDDQGLVAGHAESPLDGKSLRLSPDLFVGDALIWDRLASRRLAYHGPTGTPRLEIAFPDTPFMGVWQKPGAGYICIEPWHGLADAADFAGDFRDRPGVITLPPGAVHCLRMDVTVVPA
ncbi:aldose 1-epimerase family protein [Novosphingobium album (ex Liu et al. 2023)]|uniref:Aldose 1-epimerase family protein n=1 Tax=Novosphingobium album (ex Liu et al. 2023) TaxID=3031130 RepID=A0ABT5WNI7_9SPHN|nr:aldose 1-epimerase family protein [Novosphingobium album (ex Liu et al. 2023)]MDE8650832.1 aldose 1-epimerase family protein [Novosphingobium album (ex Liu et al. 2023)]